VSTLVFISFRSVFIGTTLLRANAGRLGERKPSFIVLVENGFYSKVCGPFSEIAGFSRPSSSSLAKDYNIKFSS